MLDILRHIQKLCHNKPIHELFDLIVATSTGAFIAGALAARHTLDRLETEYWNVCHSFIEAKPTFFNQIKRFLNGYIINPDVIYTLLHGLVGDITLEDLPAEPKLCLVATDITINVPQPYIFRNRSLPSSIESKFPYTSKIKVRDALRASTAAPTYYPSHQIDHEQKIADGAIHSNNPIIFALAEAAIQFPKQPIDMVVSLGSGTIQSDYHKLETSPPSGMISWTNTLITMSTETEIHHHLAETILGNDHYIRLSPTNCGECHLWETDKQILQQWRTKVQEYCESMTPILETVVVQKLIRSTNSK